jgi:hypothetical protein
MPSKHVVNKVYLLWIEFFICWPIDYTVSSRKPATITSDAEEENNDKIVTKSGWRHHQRLLPVESESEASEAGDKANGSDDNSSDGNEGHDGLDGTLLQKTI